MSILAQFKHKFFLFIYLFATFFAVTFDMIKTHLYQKIVLFCFKWLFMHYSVSRLHEIMTREICIKLRIPLFTANGYQNHALVLYCSEFTSRKNMSVRVYTVNDRYLKYSLHYLKYSPRYLKYSLHYLK